MCHWYVPRLPERAGQSAMSSAAGGFCLDILQPILTCLLL